MTSHNRKWKEAKKEEIKKLAEEYSYIALINSDELPANIISVLRKKLKGEAKIIVAKLRVIQKAFEESGIKTEKMVKKIEGNVGIIFSKKNPFELYSFIKKNKGERFAKAGDIAEKDIIIQAGDTGMPPGPALGLLKGIGLKVQVQGPTISVMNDKKILKKGDEINAQQAEVITKLGMTPMSVGMEVKGVLDKKENEFYTGEVLDVDEEELFKNMVKAYQQALNLAVNAEYFTKESTEIIITKAEREARAVKEATGDKKEETSDMEEEIKEVSEQVEETAKNEEKAEEAVNEKEEKTETKSEETNDEKKVEDKKEEEKKAEESTEDKKEKNVEEKKPEETGEEKTEDKKE